MKDQADDNRSPIIAGALILTAVLVGLFAWLLGGTAMPASCPAGLWLLDRLSCLRPNELGDTFSGAFAPVAFVWLVAAVLLQRNELGAQRQELRESRAVATQQVEEARKNVEFIAEQTHILREQLDAAQVNRADEEIRQMIAVAVRLYREVVRWFELSDGDGSVDEDNAPRDPVYTPDSIDGNDIELEQFYTVCVMPPMAILHAKAHLASAEFIFYRGWTSVMALSEVLSEIDAASQRASIPLLMELRRSNASRGVEQIEELRQLLKQYGKLDPKTKIFEQAVS